MSVLPICFLKHPCKQCSSPLDISSVSLKTYFIFSRFNVISQGLIEENNLGVGNVNTSVMRYVLDYYTLCRLLTFSYYNTLKMKKELFVFVLISFFITLINLGAQIRGAQTQYTVVSFGLNQHLSLTLLFFYQYSISCYSHAIKSWHVI